MFKVVDFQLIEGLRSCENCGHEIKQLYTVQDESGKRLTVGSECVVHLCGRIHANLERRAKRASSQWRKQNPKPLKDETRVEYINRRVAEMGRAMAAYNAWTVFYKHDFVRMADKLKRRGFKLCGIPFTEWHGFISCACPEYVKWGRCRHFLFHDLVRHFVKRIGRKMQANPYDFHRPVWEVRKL